MEIWVIAEILGVNDPEDPLLAGQTTEEDFWRESRALHEDRVRRVAEGLPPPVAPSPGPQVTPDMIRALRERRAQREAAKQQGA